MSDFSSADYEAMAAQTITQDKGKYLGPFLMAMVIDSVFYGYIINQFITWVTSSHTEKRHVRVLVVSAMIVCTVTTVFTWSTMMKLFVYGFGTYAQFTNYRYIGRYGVLCSLAVTAIQLFYADRAFHLTKRNVPLLVVTILLIALGLAGGLGFAIVSRGQPMFEANKTTMTFLYLWPAATSVADVIITGAISYALLRSKTGWSRTDAVIVRLVQLSAECQLPPTLLALAFIIMHAINSHLVISVVLLVIHPKVYLWGCLTVLNARESLLQQGSNTITNSALHSTPYVRTSSPSPTSLKGVLITQETVVETSPSALALDVEMSTISPQYRLNRDFGFASAQKHEQEHEELDGMDGHHAFESQRQPSVSEEGSMTSSRLPLGREKV